MSDDKDSAPTKLLLQRMEIAGPTVSRIAKLAPRNRREVAGGHNCKCHADIDLSQQVSQGRLLEGLRVALIFRDRLFDVSLGLGEARLLIYTVKIPRPPLRQLTSNRTRLNES
jgi:hypothetical protein